MQTTAAAAPPWPRRLTRRCHRRPLMVLRVHACVIYAVEGCLRRTDHDGVGRTTRRRRQRLRGRAAGARRRGRRQGRECRRGVQDGRLRGDMGRRPGPRRRERHRGRAAGAGRRGRRHGDSAGVVLRRSVWGNSRLGRGRQGRTRLRPLLRPCRTRLCPLLRQCRTRLRPLLWGMWASLRSPRK